MTSHTAFLLKDPHIPKPPAHVVDKLPVQPMTADERIASALAAEHFHTHTHTKGPDAV